MSPLQLIEKYTADNLSLREVLILHSSAVAVKALSIVDSHPEWDINRDFIYAAAMLHDIGCVCVDAPSIHCLGSDPYICHGLRGAEILQKEGFPKLARVAERHTGTGLTCKQIEERNLPLPHQDFLPETLEEQIVCYADKFYSKTKLDQTKSFEQALNSLRKFGEEGVQVFTDWHDRFEG